jgi:hypothetical protein
MTCSGSSKFELSPVVRIENSGTRGTNAAGEIRNSAPAPPNSMTDPADVAGSNFQVKIDVAHNGKLRETCR